MALPKGVAQQKSTVILAQLFKKGVRAPVAH